MPCRGNARKGTHRKIGVRIDEKRNGNQAREGFV